MSRLRDASTETPPLPSRELMLRVGLLPTDDLATAYVTLGRAVAEDLVELMPPGWTLEGRRVLDFGCGAGRVLRHFAESGDTVFAGCDVDAASIDWLRGNMPWVDAFVVGEAPPAPRPDGAYDVIWAASVFTHLTDHWAAWLLDLHRLLSDGGLLIASFLGPAMSPSIAGEPWDPDRIGMNPVRYGESWNRCVLHSPWWIRAHWGRAFDVVELHESGFGSPAHRSEGHGVVVLRRKPVTLSVDDLTELEDDPREVAALRHNVAQLQREVLELRRALADQSPDVPADADDAHQIARMYESTVSWRVTRPLRAIRRIFS